MEPETHNSVPTKINNSMKNCTVEIYIMIAFHLNYIIHNIMFTKIM